MIKLTADCLSGKERVILRKFSRFVIDKFVKKSVQRNTLIIIKLVDPKAVLDKQDKKDLKIFRAWCVRGISDGKRTFEICINKKEFKSSGKKILTRLHQIMLCLGHELVHVKQYMNNEIFDYVDGNRVRYKGKIFEVTEDDENYYDMPYEIEAYGREQGLYKIFKKKYQEEHRG